MPKIRCHICNKPNKTEVNERCKKCDADLKNPGTETKYKEKPCQYLTSKIGGGWNGVLYLTDKRLFFYQTTPILVGLGITGYNHSKISFSFSPKQIHSAGKNISVVFTSTLTVNTTDGESYRLAMPRKACEEWYDAIGKFGSNQLQL